VCHGHILGDLPNEIVLLIAAVEECGRKGTEPLLFCNPRRMGETKPIAVPASFLLAKYNLPQEQIEGIGILSDDRQSFLIGIRGQCIETSSILQIGVDIGVVE
jgi:hypothetical protein